jgi:hypothetical protein
MAAAMTKIAAVRKALRVLGKNAMPIQIQDYVKTLGVEMSTAHVSNYKTYLLKGKKGKKKGRKKGASEVAATMAPAPVKAKEAGTLSIADIEAVKDLVGKVGQENLKNLVGLLGG